MNKRSILPIILFIYLVVLETCFIMWNLYPETYNRQKFLFNSIVFTFIYAIISFLSSMFMNPGIISQAESETSTDQDDEEKLYCPACQIYRPPRSHHCKTCGVCVAFKDHHCKYLNNCIGARNYRSFMIFLFSSATNFLLLAFTSIFSLLSGKNTFSSILTLIVIPTSSLLFVSIVKQIIPQISFLYHNMTWVESSKLKTQYSQFLNKNMPSKYDTGSLYENLKQRLGSNPLLWIFPIPNTTKISSFPINPNYIPWNEFDPGTEAYEPKSSKRARNRFLY